MNSIGWIEQARSGSPLRAPAAPPQPRLRRVVVATLGLGIGGTTAVFSVVQAVLLAPLPYEQPGQLVRFYQQEPDKPDTRSFLAGYALHVPPRARGVVRGRRGARALLRDRASTWSRTAAPSGCASCACRAATSARSARSSALGRGFDRDDETGTRRVVLSDASGERASAPIPSIVGDHDSSERRALRSGRRRAARLRGSDRPGRGGWIPYRLASDTYEENNSLTAHRPAAQRRQSRTGAGRAGDADAADEGTLAGRARRARRRDAAARRARGARARPAAPGVRRRRRSCCSSPA